MGELLLCSKGIGRRRGWWLIRFPNQVALNAFWDDPEYQPLKELRQRAARAKVIAVEGV